MKKLMIQIGCFFLCGVVIINSCNKSAYKKFTTTPIELKIPDSFPQPQYKFLNNSLTEEGFQLGRKLFYDGRLSKDGNYPCSSCHQQFAGFTTFDHDLSHGYMQQHTTRNAPGLFNLVWQDQFSWDGANARIEDQSLSHIVASNEMAEDMNAVIRKLRPDTAYKRMFRAAFGDEIITRGRMLNALSQFVVLLISSDSKFDKVKKGQATFNSAEEAGYQLFTANCASCHTEPLFTDNSFRNIGLPLNPTLNDVGRMRITRNKFDSLKFRVPSLRNVFLTSYYSHDGRFSTITALLDHYSTYVQDGPTLDPLLKNRIPLTDNEKFYLVQFLGTLTDTAFINNTRFSEP